MVLSLLLSLANLLAGSVPEGLGAGVGALVCGAVLGLWARTGRLSVVTTFYGLVQTTLFAVSAVMLGQPSYLAWLSLGPLTLTFFAGRRAGALWLAVAALAAIVAGGFFVLGAVPLQPEPGPFLRSFRAAIFIPSVAVIGFLFETVRLRTMESLRRARQAAEQANQEKDRFLANVSHEIRTPLNGVLGMTEALLTARDEMPAQVREGLGVIQQSGQLLRVLIDDLLDLARAREGRLELDTAPFLPSQLVEEVGSLHSAAAQLRGLTYRMDVEVPRDLRLVGDRVRLAQILNNLVANAIKFTSRGGVTVGARTRTQGPAEVLELSVRDTGPGISAGDRPRLFKAFGQLGTARGLGGTGLGLAVCHQLAQLMGGRIELESAPGQGSTFTLVVPLVRAKGAPVSLAGAPGDPGRYAGTALVVDDNAINNRVASALLSQAGLSVTIATDGKGALERLATERFDLVFMDCHMPVMDGFEATRELRRRERVASLRRTPVIALTASALAEELDACFAAGMDDCLTKPMTVPELRAVLERTLGGGPAVKQADERGPVSDREPG